MILLNLWEMQGEISKYYIFSGSKELYRRRFKPFWIKYFRVSSFIRVILYSEAYFNLKFSGVCIDKTFKGLGSTFELADRVGIHQRFYFFSPTVKSITLIKFLEGLIIAQYNIFC